MLIKLCVIFGPDANQHVPAHQSTR